jgi:hypothetical protein
VAETPRPAADADVRDAIAAADDLRRRRAAARAVWRVAPRIAAGGLGLAAVGWWIGWPRSLTIAALAGIVLSLALVYVFSRRRRPVTDAIASQIDAEAALGGELRSAGWFASRDVRDAWADLHLTRAAARLRDANWTELYPPVRARRARAASISMIAAATIVAVAVPERAGLPWGAPAQAAKGDPSAEPVELPPELQMQLEELLAAAETGTVPIEGNSVTAIQMRELLERLGQLHDRELLKALARAMDADNRADASAAELKDLADRARHAAELNASAREFREAMEQLARNLSEAARAEQMETGEAREGRSPENARAGDAGDMSASTALDEATIQAVKEAQAAAGGDAVFMTSSQDARAGAAPPGAGVGGAGSSNAQGNMTAIERALRQEIIDASADNAGANVEAQIRRRTEQGQATSEYTHAAAGRSDRSRAAAPPAVPESRRAGVQRYFIRKQ